jgi:hypothetical protein
VRRVTAMLLRPSPVVYLLLRQPVDRNCTRQGLHRRVAGTDDAQRDIAVTIASDLASISWHVPVARPN